MSCEHAEQPLSRSLLEDTRACALMEIMMDGLPRDICLFACSLQLAELALTQKVGAGAQVTHGSPGAAPGREAGAGAAGAHGGLGAAPSREAGDVVLT
jgi:hypothetical protein